MLSIIIPTYNEAQNLPELIKQIKALDLPEYEILIVDDNSPDGTAAVARQLGAETIVRTTDRGLSQSVIAGFQKARGDYLLVMDADLSHPVEAIPALVTAIQAGAQVAIGSRYVDQGELQNWQLIRKFYSWLATLVVRPLTPVKDPMAGFFCLDKNVWQRAPLKPRGYKILLEILVRCRVKNFTEIPITFTDRTQGQSKLNLKVKWDYFVQLLSLYWWRLTHLFA
jgi:dolichol-phosphate mannosyltransferase